MKILISENAGCVALFSQGVFGKVRVNFQDGRAAIIAEEISDPCWATSSERNLEHHPDALFIYWQDGNDLEVRTQRGAYRHATYHKACVVCKNIWCSYEDCERVATTT